MGFLSRLFRRTPPTPALSASALRADWLVVGLGNPGAQYAATRHNVGYMAIDDLLAMTGDVLTPLTGFKAQVAQINIDDAAVVVVRPTTYMNLSGEAIGPLAQHLGVEADHIICVHDELDLPPHKVRLKQGGNENGHNGLKSLTEHVGSRDYLRVRIGIGRPSQSTPVPEHVLGPVDSGRDFDASIALAADAVRAIINSGLHAAQNQIHSR